jgi:hypothetical protein
MLKVSDVVKVDEAPSPGATTTTFLSAAPVAPLVRVHVDGETSYVMCERCERLAPRTIFDNPVP